jgi:hypothetical protein
MAGAECSMRRSVRIARRQQDGLNGMADCTPTMKQRSTPLTCISPVLYRENRDCPGICGFTSRSIRHPRRRNPHVIKDMKTVSVQLANAEVFDSIRCPSLQWMNAETLQL